jgi:hypothetical protein
VEETRGPHVRRHDVLDLSGPETRPGRNFSETSRAQLQFLRLDSAQERGLEPAAPVNVSSFWEVQRMDDRAEVLIPTEARQASPRRLNFRVLVLSMLLALAVAAMLYYAIYQNPRSAIGMPDQPAATDMPPAAAQ